MAAPADRALLMGYGSSQLNMAAVRARAEELKRSVQDVVDALAAGATLHWEDFLKKFTIVNQQIASLRETLRGVLKQAQYIVGVHATRVAVLLSAIPFQCTPPRPVPKSEVVVHPKLVDRPDVAAALPIQLASMITPDMEAREAALVAEAEEAAASVAGGGDGAGAAAGSSNPAAAAALRAQRYEQVSSQLDAFNRFLSTLCAHGGPLHAQAPPRKEIERGSRANQALAAEGSAALLAGGALSPAGGDGGGHAPKRARVGSQGGDGAGSSKALDPGLAALLFGEGLRAAQ
ncbi:hypothetical protein FOA52_010096 [Chlamydomonas sp. UWO 241]|nr:hypothetical protein FOA52_010096 [Chlamydomonas sp. UWO 241]